ncbi:MAG: hypothetical protein ACHQ0J_10650 [Candidatus Dormibacterales bacterium]
MSRREFLAAANAAALLLLVESCDPGGILKSAASPSVPPGSSPYEKALTLLRDAVRASPDHLALRAAELVAQRDATRIVNFVRDQISVAPPFSSRDDHTTARRWGSAATLRGGQGTLRERADILADMLTRAGFAAKVSSANRPSAATLDGLYQPRAAAFAPDQARIDLAKSLLRAAGASAPASPQPFDAGPDPTSAILAALPASLQTAKLRDDLLPPKVPVVEFDNHGKKQYAYALGGTDIADAAPSGLATLGGADSLPTVTVTVSALSNSAIGSRTPRGRFIDLVSARWSADQVVGSQVLLTFAPPQGPKAILDSGLSSFPIRVPILRVQTDAPPASTASTLAVAGPLITLRGDVLSPPDGASPAPAGSIDGPFGTMQTLSASDRTAAIGRAAAIKAVANGTAFPEVEVQFTITDSAGASVDGLDATSLTVGEQGKQVSGFTLFANVQSKELPRVLITYDTSGSVSDLWPSAAAKTNFETELATAIAAAAAKTPFAVQVIGLGGYPDAKAWVPAQADTIAAALHASNSISSLVWGTIAGPSLDQNLAAIIIVSDNQDTDTSPNAIPSLQRRLAASKVPVFSVTVGKPDENTTAQIVSVSGGARLDPNDPVTPTRLAALVAARTVDYVGSAYRLRYTAQTDGPTHRSVTIGLTGRSQPQGNTAYDVPATPDQPPSFVGLYVTVEMTGGLRSLRRLAGVEVASLGAPLGDLEDPVAAAETLAVINGITTIAIEPGTTTTAALLDDVLSSCLSFEPLRNLWGTATNDQLLRAVGNGVRRMPATLASILLPVKPDPHGLPSLKVAILQERALDLGSVQQHADFAVGANPVIPVTADARAAFRSVLATSLGASITEAATFTDSAYRRLAGKQLTGLPAGDFAASTAFLNTVPAAKLNAWTEMTRIYNDHHLIVPAAGAGDAFWIVDPDSGAAKAVLLDGTGGAVIHQTCHFDPFDELALEIALLSVACGFTGQIFPFACLGINSAATAMTVTALFTDHADPGSPFGAAYGLAFPFGSGVPGLDPAIGIMLIMVTLQKACS